MGGGGGQSGRPRPGGATRHAAERPTGEARKRRRSRSRACPPRDTAQAMPSGKRMTSPAGSPAEQIVSMGRSPRWPMGKGSADKGAKHPITQGCVCCAPAWSRGVGRGHGARRVGMAQLREEGPHGGEKVGRFVAGPEGTTLRHPYSGGRRTRRSPLSWGEGQDLEAQRKGDLGRLRDPCQNGGRGILEDGGAREGGGGIGRGSVLVEPSKGNRMPPGG